MKVFRGILVTVLILVIVGGIGYIGWSFLAMPGMNHSGMNSGTASSTNTPQDQMPNMQNNTNQNNTNQSQAQSTNVNTVTMNTIAVQNKNRLSAAIGTIDQAMSLITLDPYSSTTESSALPSTANTQQPTMGSSSMSIIPSGKDRNVIIITPDNGYDGGTISSNANQSNNGKSVDDYVYDQAKLEQLHNGIFTLAQGITEIKSLNDDLLMQATMAEANPANYQTYVTRFNLALQNKTKLESALSKISQGSVLINVNPYASADGYNYNDEAMQRLHKGVYKMAEGVAQLSQLKDSLSQQMINASVQGQNLVNTSNQMTGMTGMNMTTGIFGAVSATTVFQIILIIFVIGLIGGVIGAIFNMFKSRSRSKEEEHVENYTI